MTLQQSQRRLYGLVFAVVALSTIVLAREDAKGYFLTEAIADGAVCLDGSPGLYYHQKGTGYGKHKWHIHHEGGGWCTSENDCDERAQTKLGSTKGNPPSFNLDLDELPNLGYFLDDPEANPMMWNWNMVYLRQCDGGSFSGDGMGKCGNTTLYYRGKALLHAMRASLLSIGLSDATDVVISGCSAGGIGALMQLDWWREGLPSTARVVGLADGAFFLDYMPEFRNTMMFLTNNMNINQTINRRCVEFYKDQGESWRCFFAEYLLPHITTPVFIIQSRYDSYQVNDYSEAEIVKFGNKFTSTVKNLFAGPATCADGLFLYSCRQHCGWNIGIDKVMAAHAFEAWYISPSARHTYYQGQSYPCHECCTDPTLVEASPYGGDLEHRRRAKHQIKCHLHNHPHKALPIPAHLRDILTDKLS